jgi:tetratricopeptide (TPR) repeat protein
MLARTRRPLVALLVVLAIACDRDDAPAPVPIAEPTPAPSPSEADVVSAARLQRSIELEQQGDLATARIEAEAAVAAGGGRDAKLQVAKLAILERRYADAQTVLEPLVQANAGDAAAQYDLALVRQHQGDYNKARNGYLATLRADGRYADARYNLAVLCLDHGFTDEAKHHVAKFRTAFPEDARGPELERRIGGTGAAGPSGGAPPSTPPPVPPP